MKAKKAKYVFIVLHDGYVSFRTDQGHTGSTPAKTLSETENAVFNIKKLFNLTSKQTEIRNDRVKKNPARRGGKRVIHRAGLKLSAYIRRPSQITRKAPGKRLAKRRAKRVARPVKGFFPNPFNRFPYIVTDMKGVVLQSFGTKAGALKWAKEFAKTTNQKLRIVKG